MNIVFENGKLTVADATSIELKSFCQYLMEVADIQVPFNSVSQSESIDISVPEEVEVVEIKTDETPVIERVGSDNSTYSYRSALIPEGYISTSELARLSGRTVSAIRNYQSRNAFTNSIKVANTRYYKKDEALAVLSEHFNANPAPVPVETSEESKTVILYSGRELAAIYNIPHSTYTKRLVRHKIPYILNGNTRMYDKKITDKDLEDHPYNPERFPLHYTRRCVKKVEPYDEWIAKMTDDIKKSGLDVGKTLSLCYKKLNKDYGIVWDQLHREYGEYYGERTKHVSRLVYFYEYVQKNNDCTTNLFEGILSDVIASELQRKLA